MQVALNKCFVLNLEKKLAQIQKTTHFNLKKNNVTEPKARLLYQPVNRLKICFMLSKTI